MVRERSKVAQLEAGCRFLYVTCTVKPPVYLTLQSLWLYWQLTGARPWEQGLAQHWLAPTNILEASSGDSPVV